MGNFRWFSQNFAKELNKPWVHILFGARQTGKTTLIQSCLEGEYLSIDLSSPSERIRLESDPNALVAQCLALKGTRQTVYIDEAQMVPAVFDAVQHLFDKDRKRWRFILCGSSARKLRQHGANLLPGRSMLHILQPLILQEHPYANTASGSILPIPAGMATAPVFSSWGIEERLAFGALPGIVDAPPEDRSLLLRSYTTLFLEEEIRREASLREWGSFLRFVKLAAHESGNVLNFTNLSRESGVSIPTIKSYYQLLEDMFLGFRMESFQSSARKTTLSTPRFFFFDLGVRMAASGLNPSLDSALANPGPLFEQWVGLELWRRLKYLGEGDLKYWRTKDGAEVDFVLEQQGKIIPIEVKWTERPNMADCKHLLPFLEAHAKSGARGSAQHGYVVCRCPYPMQLHEKITALPWWCI